jgi:flagellar motor component MotA
MTTLAVEVESIALNSIVGASGLVAALTWLDVVRNVVARVIKVPQDTLGHSIIAALLTTLLSVIVYMIIKYTARNITVQKPGQVFAVTRAS